MSKELSIVLVSGGMDSCVTAAIAAQEYEMAFLHINYGQRTERRELQDSTLEVQEADLNRKDIPTSYVPFRNANILSIAVSWGEVLRAKRIFIGAVEEDSSGYPDCRSEFYSAFNKVIKLGTKPDSDLKIEIPIIHLKKSEIVKNGIQLNAPFHLTWSCYQREDVACGVCDSCALRLRGFQKAGFSDPLPYIKKPNYH
ncbi:MAG: 7-cyano-7-deazaguanine synthase [Ignavibacteriales bacterium]|nr:7-cyano-7-deazaguanine synthase [Ignavibacteriales bacterium]